MFHPFVPLHPSPFTAEGDVGADPPLLVAEHSHSSTRCTRALPRLPTHTSLTFQHSNTVYLLAHPLQALSPCSALSPLPSSQAQARSEMAANPGSHCNY